MKIGIDGRALLSLQKTGVENYIFNLIKGLARIDKKNKYVIYLHKESGGLAREFPANFSFRALKFPFLWTQIRLPIDFLFEKPDIFFFPAHSMPFLGRSKAVVVIQDLAFLHLPEIYPLNERIRLSLLTKNAIKKATHIIAISESTKKDILKFYSIPSAKISVIYHGYDEEVFKPNPTEKIVKIKQKYKLKNPYIIFLATLHKHSLERLIKAFYLLKKKKFPQKLVLVGKPGWLYRDLLDLIKKLDLKKEIILPGYVPIADVPLLLQGAEAFVFPSLYEGFGLPVLEAMACGVPVIASSVASIPEIVDDVGILINPYNVKEMAEVMEKIIKNPTLSQKLRKKGLKKAKLFSWRKCIQETLKIIQKTARQ
jgi:glycosyltransferase involved in cell wall biosynthesis